MKQCRICDGETLGDPIVLTEMMFGTAAPFAYVSCADCGCLQIIDPPADMSVHYGPGYYSFDAPDAGIKGRLRDWLTLNGPSALFGNKDWFRRGNWRALADVPRNASIIDIGCGSGGFIRELRKFGFNAVGADPFIAAPIMADGVELVAKCAIDDITQSYDVVMMHHSLEHVPDQIGTLAQVRRILAPGGTAIIRVPVIDSWAAEHFGQQWAHLDPPRHFFLHTRKSLRLAAERAGLTVSAIRDDYNDFGVRGSLALRSGFTSIARDPLDPGVLAGLLDQHRQASQCGRADMVTLFAHA